MDSAHISIKSVGKRPFLITQPMEELFGVRSGLVLSESQEEDELRSKQCQKREEEFVNNKRPRSTVWIGNVRAH